MVPGSQKSDAMLNRAEIGDWSQRIPIFVPLCLFLLCISTELDERSVSWTHHRESSFILLSFRNFNLFFSSILRIKFLRTRLF